MSAETTSAITLKALEGEPLRHERIREMVVATAHAIAERQGIEVLAIGTTSSSITAHLVTGRIEALGFAAELRRLTTSWYRHKYGEVSLWGEAEPEEGDEWKTS